MSTPKERKKQTQDAVLANKKRGTQDKGDDTRQPGHLPGSTYLEQRYLGNNYLQSTEEKSQIVRSEVGPPEVTAQEGTGKTIQAKLTVSQPGDKYEREADMIADLVMQRREPVEQQQQKDIKSSRQTEPLADQVTPLDEKQHAASQPPSELSELEARIQTLKGSGQPLPVSTRAFFEPRFGCDLGHVRIHTDSQAAEITHAVNAKAFTVGGDVVLGVGQYEPTTAAGRKLLAHELAHVLQQGECKLQRISRSEGDTEEEQITAWSDTQLLDRLEFLNSLYYLSRGRLGSGLRTEFENLKEELSKRFRDKAARLSLEKLGKERDDVCVQVQRETEKLTTRYLVNEMHCRALNTELVFGERLKALSSRLRKEAAAASVEQLWAKRERICLQVEARSNHVTTEFLINALHCRILEGQLISREGLYVLGSGRPSTRPPGIWPTEAVERYKLALQDVSKEWECGKVVQRGLETLYEPDATEVIMIEQSLQFLRERGESKGGALSLKLKALETLAMAGKVKEIRYPTASVDTYKKGRKQDNEEMIKNAQRKISSFLAKRLVRIISDWTTPLGVRRYGNFFILSLHEDFHSVTLRVEGPPQRLHWIDQFGEKSIRGWKRLAWVVRNFSWPKEYAPAWSAISLLLPPNELGPRD